ncbi:MAG: phosphotransferase [Anaerolineae bacterium]|nr:phosphotransferase [Anaerolineae bacterium]
MNDLRLQRIQALQFTDKAAAEQLLLSFVRELFPKLAAIRAELRPQAVSLNSFNGYLTLADGRRLFFKTHVEPNSVIGEYYNAQTLAEVGYPVIAPLYASTEYGKQFLIYDVINAPSVFEVAYALEHGERTDLGALTAAQHAADARLLEIYRATLRPITAAENANAPVHQLFYHRLTGGRYAEFYLNKPFQLPNGYLDWEDLLQRRWIINGKAYPHTLGTLIERAKRALEPDQPAWSIVGHGDAHNGNVFFTAAGLRYFDPAFGGRHHPLLDLAKPLFHNVLATWMYHPQEVAAQLQISYHDDGTTLHVQHNYAPSAVRQMFRASKVERVLEPIWLELTRRGESPQLLTELLQSALLCCPLLTLNLADRGRFPPEIGLLGLVLCVVVGSEPVF